MKFEKDMGVEEIKIIKNFLSPEEVDFYIKYIDDNEHKFRVSAVSNNTRKVLMFGKDINHKEKSELTFDKVSDIANKLQHDLFPRVEAKVKEVFNNKKDLMICSFFIAKQTSGATIEEHIDTDGGLNMQFKYGGVIYLNKMTSGGKLKFPEFNYEYNPEPGDFVIFPSRPLQYRHAVEEIHQDRYSLPIWLTEYPFWKL